MHVREARPDDYADFLRFWPELITEQRPPERDRWIALLMPNTLFLDADGDVAGYALAFPFGERGDVRQLAVAPAWRGKGVGRQLMDAIAARLRAAGCREWRLEVREHNEPALALYRAVGMRVLHALESLRMPADVAERFSATRSGRLAVVAVEPAQDAELEARFDFGRGQLARWRAVRPSGVMYQIPDAALAHYTPDFAPELALLFPLRAPDADHAAHLIAHACAIELRAAIELLISDAPVAEALRAAGAQLRDRLLEMTGPLL